MWKKGAVIILKWVIMKENDTYLKKFMEEKQQMRAWSDDQWRFPYLFFSVTERWAGNANEHLWSTRRDAWFHAACASALLADSHVNLCFTGIFPLPCLIKYFLLLYMRFFFMLEELCFVFFSSISTIDFAPIFGIQYKARSMGIVFPNKIYKIIANHKCFL